MAANNTTIPLSPADLSGSYGVWRHWFPLYADLLSYATAQCLLTLRTEPTSFAPPSGFNWSGRPTCADLALPVSIQLKCASAQGAARPDAYPARRHLPFGG